VASLRIEETPVRAGPEEAGASWGAPWAQLCPGAPRQRPRLPGKAPPMVGSREIAGKVAVRGGTAVLPRL
jgi:hypothetical protein